MRNVAWWKVAVVVALGVAILGVMQIKEREPVPEEPAPESTVTAAGVMEDNGETTETAAPAKESVPDEAPPAGLAAAQRTPPATTQGKEEPVARTKSPESPPRAATATAKALPRFIELGADKCMPCKMMKPILEELRRDYADTLRVEYYDVWKDPHMAEKYGVRFIPTQVLLDSEGKEIYRHDGFWPKEEILAKFAELGINLEQ